MSSVKALATENHSLKSRISAIRKNARESADKVQSSVTRIAGAGAAGYVTAKFGSNGQPLTVFGMSAPLVLGGALTGVGLLAGSQAMTDAGEGMLILAAGDFGASMARAQPPKA